MLKFLSLFDDVINNNIIDKKNPWVSITVGKSLDVNNISIGINEIAITKWLSFIVEI